MSYTIRTEARGGGTVYILGDDATGLGSSPSTKKVTTATSHSH